MKLLRQEIILLLTLRNVSKSHADERLLTHRDFHLPAAARAHGHSDAPAYDALLHRLRPGDGGRSSWRHGARGVGRLSLPGPGECGGGPDQPAQQRVGVRSHLNSSHCLSASPAAVYSSD